MHQQTICITDDDSDQETEPLFKRMKNGKEVPFMIICDVNLPTINGFELRERLSKDSRMEAILVPFISWSSYASSAQIRDAYELKARGLSSRNSVYQNRYRSFNTGKTVVYRMK